jgi:hypothetical protein
MSVAIQQLAAELDALQDAVREIALEVQKLSSGCGVPKLCPTRLSRRFAGRTQPDGRDGYGSAIARMTPKN